MKSSVAAFALAIAIVAAGGPAISQETDRQERALGAAALAHAYGERCPDWKVNWHRYVKFIEAAGIDTGKMDKEPTFSRMIAAAERAEQRIKALDNVQICKLAETEFGPRGTLEVNLMSNSLAIRGMNKLFEWLDKD